MSIWLIMTVGGLITFGLRFSMIYLFGRLEIPGLARRALRYVPPAVLSAIVFPELFLHAGELDLSIDNERLLAGVIAILAGALTRHMLFTIMAGITALLLIQWLS